MRAVLLFCLFSLPFFDLWAQETWLRGNITDEAGRQLAYVSIGIAGTSIGTVSKPDGSFRLLLPAAPKPTDTLRISHIGFETLSFPLEKTVGKNLEKLVFTLSPAIHQLTTIEIKPGQTKRKTFGSSFEHTLISTNFSIAEQPLQNLGAAIGKRFNLKGKPHFLQELNMFVAYNNFDTVVFRLQVHKLRNGKPAGSLLTENIYFTLVKHRKGWATFDLKPYELVFNEKVLLSLEWVGHSAKGKYIGLPLALPLPGAVHYYKFGSQAYWKVYQTMSTSINLVTEAAK